MLSDVQMGAANTANADSNIVIGQELASNLTTALVEGGRKHHITMISILINIYVRVSTL